MSGEKDLKKLLSCMDPVLKDEEYVFLTFPEGHYGDGAHLKPIGTFNEDEGLTMIVTKDSAESNNMGYEATYRCVSLQVHSSLEAVGLTAAISTRLAGQGISANVVAGFYHDHVFVPADKAEQALRTLQMAK